MGALKRSKAHALAVHDDNKKNKQKLMDCYHIDEESIGSSKETFNPKGGNSKEIPIWNYLNKGFHHESSCMVKEIDQGQRTLPTQPCRLHTRQWLEKD